MIIWSAGAYYAAARAAWERARPHIARWLRALANRVDPEHQRLLRAWQRARTGPPVVIYDEPFTCSDEDMERLARLADLPNRGQTWQSFGFRQGPPE